MKPKKTANEGELNQNTVQKKITDNEGETEVRNRNWITKGNGLYR